MSDIFRFIVDVAEHWQALLTGGVLMAILAIVERKNGKQLPWTAFRWIAVMALFVACYLAWHDQYKAAMNAAQASTLRSRSISLIRDLKVFQSERRKAEALASGTPEAIGVGAQSVRLFRENFSARLHAFASELPN